MRVLFIEVDTESAWAVASIGPAFLASYLREHDHEVEFFRAPLEMSVDALAERVRGIDPQLIGVSLTTRQWQRARFLIRELREHIDVPVIAGGLHPTFSPEVVLAQPGFDYVCLGEGEEPMLDLVRALESGQAGSSICIDNIWAEGGTRPKLRMPFDPIDELPFLARDFLDEPSGTVHMATQRGCPFPCTYCAARMYNQLYKSIDASYGRRRTHGDVIAELKEVREAGNLGYVIFLDDTFTINRPWVKEFCKIYKQEIDVPFCLHARVETVNQELLEILADGGCQQITYGVESGSKRIRYEVMRRPVKNQRFVDVFRWTREAGINVTANYMLGMPEETREDLQQTLDLAEELDVLDFGYFVFYPYPGTQLFSVCREKGYLPEDYLDLEANHRESILTLPTITNEDIGEFYDRFTDLRKRMYEKRYGDVSHIFERASTG